MIHRTRRWIMRFDLSDEEWVLLEPLLPKSRRSGRVDDRKIVNAIFYVLRTGIPWRDLPERYGPYTTAYIGPITSWHLAKNLGFNVAKPDRQIEQLVVWKF